MAICAARLWTATSPAASTVGTMDMDTRTGSWRNGDHARPWNAWRRGHAAPGAGHNGGQGITQPLRDCPQSPGRLVALQGVPAGQVSGICCRAPSTGWRAPPGTQPPTRPTRRGRVAPRRSCHGRSGCRGVPHRMPERRKHCRSKLSPSRFSASRVAFELTRA
jgi:hypothetical protein